MRTFAKWDIRPGRQKLCHLEGVTRRCRDWLVPDSMVFVVVVSGTPWVVENREAYPCRLFILLPRAPIGEDEGCIMVRVLSTLLRPCPGVLLSSAGFSQVVSLTDSDLWMGGHDWSTGHVASTAFPDAVTTGKGGTTSTAHRRYPWMDMREGPAIGIECKNLVQFHRPHDYHNLWTGTLGYTIVPVGRCTTDDCTTQITHEDNRVIIASYHRWTPHSPCNILQSTKEQ